MTVPERPAAPFARVFGRVVLPDGSAVSSGRLVLDPDAKHPTVSLYGGDALVVSRTEVSLDSGGRVSSIVDGVVVHWVDVVAPGEGVTPGGAWTYTVTLSVPGREWWSRMVLRGFCPVGGRCAFIVNGAGHWSLRVTAHYDYFCKTAIIGKSLS